VNPSAEAALRDSLAQVRRCLETVVPRDPCWLIGSAAAALAGADEFSPADLDLLTSARDADAFAAAYRDSIDDAFVPGDAGRFRSHFARFRFAPMPVEIMGGLEVFRDGRWQVIRIGSRMPCALLGDHLWLPSLDEQVRLFESFGRAKDLERARRLRAILETKRQTDAA